MKKLPIIAIVVVVLAAAVTVLVIANQKDTSKTEGSMSSTDTSKDQAADESSDSTPVEQNTVSISNFEYKPGNITVKVGTKVTWTNQDEMEHTVTTDDGNGPDSELLAKGESYSYTFDKAGTYTYHCQPHPYMKGTVTVTE